jgi:uncharacterized membrane protein
MSIIIIQPKIFHDQHHHHHRDQFIDFLRGLGLFFIVIFHFVWDLKFFGFLDPIPHFDRAKGE